MNKAIALLAVSLHLTGCSVSRHYYTTEAPVRAYEEDFLASRRLVDIPAGETLIVRNRAQVGSLYLIPVEYKGYRLYVYAPELRYTHSKRFAFGSGRRPTDLPSFKSQTESRAARHYRSYPGGRMLVSDETVPVARPLASTREE